MKITFRVDVIPVAKGRPKVARRGSFATIYTPAETVRAEDDFIALADRWKPPAPFEGPVAVSLVFWLRVPGDGWKRDAALAGAILPRGPKDVDNMAKLVLDAFNRAGCWWVDDAQVARLLAEKRYGEKPGVDVVLEELDHVTSAAAWKAHLAESRDRLASHAPLPPAGAARAGVGDLFSFMQQPGTR